jgi:hypothetical protein
MTNNKNKSVKLSDCYKVHRRPSHSALSAGTKADLLSYLSPGQVEASPEVHLISPAQSCSQDKPFCPLHSSPPNLELGAQVSRLKSNCEQTLNTTETSASVHSLGYLNVAAKSTSTRRVLPALQSCVVNN